MYYFVKSDLLPYAHFIDLEDTKNHHTNCGEGLSLRTRAMASRWLWLTCDISNGSYCDFGLLLLLPSVCVCLSNLSVRHPVWSCESAPLSLLQGYCYPIVIPDFTKHSPNPELDQMDIGIGREDQHHVLGTQVFMCGSLVYIKQLSLLFPVSPPRPEIPL